MSDLPDNFVFTIKNPGSCPACRYGVAPLKESAPLYFSQGFVLCSNCKGEVDLWKAAVESARSTPGAWSLTSVGASQTVFNHQIQAWKFHEIDLTRFGVPSDAVVLSTSYTPQGGGVFPIEWHANSPTRKILDTKLRLRLIGYPMQGADPVSDVAILIIWVHKEESEPWLYLVDALEAAANRRYSQAILLAQSVVEISLIPLIKKILEAHASKNKVDDFMRNALTYGYAINVILPFLCGERNISKMPAAILDGLNRLRRLRNEVVHEGIKAESINAAEAMELLCAAVFGFEYVRYVAPLFLQSLD